MGDLYPVSVDPLQDFFISYARTDAETDLSWARWITWQLGKVGYSTVLPPWAVRSDTDFEKEIEAATTHAKRVIIVLSPAYFNGFANQTNFIYVFKQKLVEEVERIIPVYVQECEQKFKELLKSIKCIDLSEEDEITASEILLAGVGNRGVEITIQPVFPGEDRDKVPTFPGGVTPESPLNLISGASISSFSSMTSLSLIQQIHSAFDKGDWLHVIRKVDYLSKIAPDALSPEIYHKQGRAFSEDGNKLRAGEALQSALALSTDDAQRLLLLEDYSAILVSLNQWNEVLSTTKEALRLAPNDTAWLERQQQSITRLQNSEKVVLAKSLPNISSIPPESSLKSVEIFFSYSHEDKKMLFKLEKYLRHLKRQGLVKHWHDGDINAGKIWAQEIEKHLNQADIILLLVSLDFLASDYCHSVEMQKALEMHRKGEACVVPIILRPVDWENTPFCDLQALPKGRKPIIEWSPRDKAYLDVVKGIEKVVVDRLTGNSSLS